MPSFSKLFYFNYNNSGSQNAVETINYSQTSSCEDIVQVLNKIYQMRSSTITLGTSMYQDLSGTISVYAGANVVESKKIGSANVSKSFFEDTKKLYNIDFVLSSGCENILKSENQITINFTGTSDMSHISSHYYNHSISFSLALAYSTVGEPYIEHYSTTFNINTSTESTKTISWAVPTQKTKLIEAIRFKATSKIGQYNFTFDVCNPQDDLTALSNVSLVNTNDTTIALDNGKHYGMPPELDRLIGSDSIALKNITNPDSLPYNGSITLDVWFTLHDKINVYDGTSWGKHSVYYYDGTEFKPCEVYYYNGLEFRKCNIP